MTETEWLLAEARRRQAAATTYPEQATWLCLQDFIKEQAKRLDQAEGELDGRTWDHSQW